jgi:hypothetical protein
MENYAKREVGEFGSVFYYNSEGKYHRTDGPAIIWSNGGKSWCINDKRHRLDGPAVEFSDGYKDWWLSDKPYSKSCHNRLYLFFILEPERIDINPTEDE